MFFEDSIPFSIHSISYFFEDKSSLTCSNSSLRESISLGSDEFIWVGSSITPSITFQSWYVHSNSLSSNLPSNSCILASRERIWTLSADKAFWAKVSSLFRDLIFDLSDLTSAEYLASSSR